MGFYKGKKILVTGGTGLIGQPLVEMLSAQGADVAVVSLDDPARAPKGIRFRRVDLRDFSACLQACRDKEIVFHLAGIKGSPAMTAQKPASFFVSTLMFNVNIMEAARRCRVERFLYTSTIGVYAPAAIFHEDDVWKTFPSPNDRFAGWAKRMGELQAEAYRIEYGWDKISIVRPANVYGPHDNFDSRNAMVIPSLIRRVVDGENPLKVWGDGKPRRDFIHAGDCARGMLLVVEREIHDPVNLGSGTGVTIREVAETIAGLAPNGPVPIAWDTSKPAGDECRIMDTTRARSYGFECRISLTEGIRETIGWYMANRAEPDGRYNAFTEKTGMEN